MSNIKFVKGSVVDALLKGEIDFLINQVNCQGVYASGIAKEIGNHIDWRKSDCVIGIPDVIGCFWWW